jgi:hypothetical protein
VARIAAAQRYRGFGVPGQNFNRRCLRFHLGRNRSADGLIVSFGTTLRCWCALPGARLRKPDAYSLLLASGSKKIWQNSPGRFSDGDRRWRSIIRFDRLTDVGYPSEDLFDIERGRTYINWPETATRTVTSIRGVSSTSVK